MRGRIFQSDYRPQFSGHETFPVRYGWLKKAFDAVHEQKDLFENKSVFSSDDAIARFGVGKNMVASMRHWSIVSGMLCEGDKPGQIRTTEIGKMLLSNDGLDPYMEQPATIWLTHWQLAAHETKTTWFWAFNHFQKATFDRDHLVQSLEGLAQEQQWSRVATATIKRDVDCFIRTYVTRPASNNATLEDALESPLTELGLIRAIGKRDGFRFVRGEKPSLPDGIFVYALMDFWRRHTSAMTLSLEAVAHAPGSPGRVFLLDETDLIRRMTNLEQTSHGLLVWSETAGLRQLIRNSDFSSETDMKVLREAYVGASRKEAA